MRCQNDRVLNGAKCALLVEDTQCKDFVSWPTPDESSECNREGGRCPCGGNLNECSIEKLPVEAKRECSQCLGEGLINQRVTKGNCVLVGDISICQICNGEGEVGG